MVSPFVNPVQNGSGRNPRASAVRRFQKFSGADQRWTNMDTTSDILRTRVSAHLWLKQATQAYEGDLSREELTQAEDFVIMTGTLPRV